jgi:hypothetical protein
MQTQIMFKCSIEEKEKIKNYAKKLGLKIGTYCRFCSLKEIKDN